MLVIRCMDRDAVLLISTVGLNEAVRKSRASGQNKALWIVNSTACSVGLGIFTESVSAHVPTERTRAMFALRIAARLLVAVFCLGFRNKVCWPEWHTVSI